MKLKSLEVIGFKSFVDRLHLSFPDGITVIVGPNGCGKSNIVDAILWAIGERSAKHLRGRLMEDVIFNGADGRKPLGMAEVSLTFLNDGEIAPKGYEHYSEITVTRRLYRSGESEYLINKVPCRLRDITELFLDTGIGVNGYSIVEQGRVEHLINANPQDRRFLIEEAAGIAKYKERKRLALIKMEATEQNLLRVKDIISEVKRQINTLERQVKRAEDYKAIRKEIKDIEIRFALEEFVDLSEKMESSRGYLKALKERENIISQQTQDKEALIENLRLKATEEDGRLKSLQQEVFEIGKKIQKLENEIEFLEKERSRLQRQEAQFIGEVRESLRMLREMRRERKKFKVAVNDLEKEIKEYEEIIKEWEVLFNEFKATYQDVQDQLESEKGRLIDTLTKITSIRNRKSHLEERREDLQRRIKYQDKESQEIRAELFRLEGELYIREKQREETQGLLLNLKEEKIKIEESLAELTEALQRKQLELSSLEEELRDHRSRYLSLKELQDNFEGFEQGIKSILLRKKMEPHNWERVFGVLADILEPDPKYEISLEALLGERLQYIIVEDEKVAMEAIDFLKKERQGRGTFIPLSIKRNIEHVSESRGSASQGPLSLSDFVNVKEGFSSIAEFFIGGVGVVETLEDALRHIKEDRGFNKIVTMEGDVVEHSGMITGGRVNQGLGILERRRLIRELEGKIKEEELSQRTLSKQAEELEKEIFEKEARLEEKKSEIQSKDIEILHLERDIEELRKEISQIHQKLEILQYENLELQKEEEEVDQEINGLLAQMEIEERLKQEREGILNSMKKTVEEVREGTEELGAKITEKKVILATMEEKKKALDTQIHALSENIKVLREQVIKKLESIREFRNEINSLQEKFLQGEKELEESLSNHQIKEDSLLSQKEKVESLLNDLKEIEASSRFERRELEEIRQKIHEEDLKISELQIRIKHIQESIRDRYGTNLSATLVNHSSELPREESLKRLEELKKMLEEFGEVNLMALEEYQELKKRHDFLIEQQNDLEQAIDTLKKAISRINRTTTRRFLDTFYQVNEKFKEVFTRLFKGGQASLILLDEKDPSTSGIDIIAQPPGKKLQNIDLLSGGEKALVATALLFALFMIRPTPFCLLDEVDAPLDDANINRFIDLVKEFSKKSQFIIITHNKNTMETANTLYGITMETPGVSKIVSVRLN